MFPEAKPSGTLRASQLKTRKKTAKNDLFNTTVPGCACSTSGSQTELPTRYQYFSSQLTKNKDNTKVALPFSNA